MPRQYSRRFRVSSEKHEMAAEAGVAEGGGEALGFVTATALVGSDRVLLECHAVITRAEGRTRVEIQDVRELALG